MSDIAWHYFDLGGGDLKRYSWNVTDNGQMSESDAAWFIALSPTAGKKLVILDMFVNYKKAGADGEFHMRFGDTDAATKNFFTGILTQSVAGNLAPFYYDFTSAPKVGTTDEALYMKSVGPAEDQPAAWITYVEIG